MIQKQCPQCLTEHKAFYAKCPVCGNMNVNHPLLKAAQNAINKSKPKAETKEDEKVSVSRIG